MKEIYEDWAVDTATEVAHQPLQVMLFKYRLLFVRYYRADTKGRSTVKSLGTQAIMNCIRLTLCYSQALGECIKILGFGAVIELNCH